MLSCTLARRSASILLPAKQLQKAAPTTKATCNSFAGSAAEIPRVTLGCSLFQGNIRTSIVQKGSSRRVRATPVVTMASHDIEVFGKAAAGTGSPSSVRGDCPFSQRVYMDLEEKGVSYKATYIQEGQDKPQWFMEKNPSGLMPVMRDGEKWIQDSDKIATYLEEQFPEPPLKTPEEFQSVGAGVFQAFTQWLQAKDAHSPAKEELTKELSALNDHFKNKGPFVAGEKFTEMDSALSPKLLHAQVALNHYYHYNLYQEFPAIKEYMEKVQSRQSFKNTAYPDEMIVKGWQTKFQLPDTMVPQAA